MARLVISNLLGLVGAIVGGVLGFYTFAWLEDKGFYGLAIPGAFLGLGCGMLSQHSSIPRGLLCGAGALGLSLFTEWKFHHFLVDNSFSYMVNHISEKGPVTLLMIALGTIIAFWVGKDGTFRWLPEGAASRNRPRQRREDHVERGLKVEQAGSLPFGGAGPRIPVSRRGSSLGGPSIRCTSTGKETSAMTVTTSPPDRSATPDNNGALPGPTRSARPRSYSSPGPRRAGFTKSAIPGPVPRSRRLLPLPRLDRGRTARGRAGRVGGQGVRRHPSGRGRYRSRGGYPGLGESRGWPSWLCSGWPHRSNSVVAVSPRWATAGSWKSSAATARRPPSL